MSLPEWRKEIEQGFSISNLQFISIEDEMAYIERVKNEYLKWLNNGIHRTVKTVSEKPDRDSKRRWYTFIVENSMTKDELLSMYSTLNDWLENEYTGQTFNTPTFKCTLIYEDLEDYVWELILKINNIDKNSDRYDEILDDRDLNGCMIKYQEYFLSLMEEVKVADLVLEGSCSI
jgi:hypothetical protein